jgi:hypothetical protein
MLRNAGRESSSQVGFSFNILDQTELNLTFLDAGIERVIEKRSA